MAFPFNWVNLTSPRGATVRPKGPFYGIMISQRVGYLIMWSADVPAVRPKCRHFISTIIGDLGNLVGSEYGCVDITPCHFCHQQRNDTLFELEAAEVNSLQLR